MKSTKITLLTVWIALLLACTVSKKMMVTKTLSTRVADILAKMPARTIVERDQLMAELFTLGTEGILETARLLVPPGTGDDTNVQYALSGLSHYVNRPGAEADRNLYIQALDSALKSASDPKVKSFLIRQLQLVGTDAAIPVLAVYLSDANLNEPATQALLAIGTEAAREALLKALPVAMDRSHVTLVKALGELRHKPAMPLIIPDLKSENFDQRQVALYALANMGAPEAAAFLTQARQSGSAYERARATALYLLFAQRLADSGQAAACVGICRELIQTHRDSEQDNVYSSALSLLVSVLGEQAYDDIYSAVENGNKKVRATALEFARIKPDTETTLKWLDRLPSSPPEIRAEIIAMLGAREDKAALPALRQSLKDESAVVRLAAISAITQLGSTEVIPDLVKIFKAGESGEIIAAKEMLLTLPGDVTIPALTEILPEASPIARAALLDILSARRAKSSLDLVLTQLSDANDSVRVAAIKALGFVGDDRQVPIGIHCLVNAKTERETMVAQNTLITLANQIQNPEHRAELILETLARIRGSRRADLIIPLASLGGKKALEWVIAETKSPETQLREVALRTLSDWKDAAATEALLNIIINASENAHRIMALKGYVRLTGISEYSDSTRLAMFTIAMQAARNAEEKKVLLSGLALVRTPAAFQLTATRLANDSLQSDAALALANIALPPIGAEQGLTGTEVVAGLEKSVKYMQDDYERERVKKYLDQIKKETEQLVLPVLAEEEQSEGFVLLFNGTNLTGWIGNTRGYVAENGKIVLYPERGDGNLFTEKEYSNFILRFEFKLTAGANNGLGIRAPIEGDAAYVGMELQILDNTAHIYRDLKPYQYHGSIYGVVPAKREYLKPIGEWNYQEVIARGARIQVNLNGESIVDADIEKASRDGTIDGNDHPGLKRPSGHIGFLGHGSVVEFRNIRIKELN